MKIAIVGTGISGNLASRLLSQKHEIEVFEASSTIGGHSRTLDISAFGQSWRVDTGFMVYNERTYPNFCKVLELLGVSGNETDMSFSVCCARSGLEYEGSGLNGLFAQRRNLFRPAFLRMVRDIFRFNREAELMLKRDLGDQTLRNLLVGGGYGGWFVDKYLVPMTAAIWSCPPDHLLDFPAHFLLAFLRNHGLLQVLDKPRWKTVAGSARRYVELLTAPFRDRIHTNCPIESVFFSPAEVSEALGVSTSTIKRWVDQGVLPAHKTAGGHRKLLRADVLRLVRQENFPRLNLTLLDLPANTWKENPQESARRLFESLKQGDIFLVRSIIHGAYASGLPMETLGDLVIAPAMANIGHDWEEGKIDVMHEHRGTQICTAVLHELRPSLEANAEKDRPIAIGGNPEGDLGSVASLLIQLMLLDSGWNAVNLGANTPIHSFRVALREMKPRLIWVSACHLTHPQDFLKDYQAFYAEAIQAGAAVAVGGRGFENSVQGVLPATCFGSTLTDLARFAQTLHPRPQTPKRGRPCNESS